MALILRANRFLPLDGLRAIAFGAVFIHHAFNAPLLWSGVDLFFVLSGYLISAILFRAKDKPGYFRTFYLRRTLRIFPAFYAAIVFTVLLLPDTARAMAPWAAAFLGNFYMVAQNADGQPLSPLWSLAVEEQFYLLWPLILWLCPARRRWPVIAALIAAAPVFRFFSTIGINHFAATLLLPGRMDLLIAGAALALLQHQGGIPAIRALRTPFLIAGALAAVAFAATAATAEQTSTIYTVVVLELSLVVYTSVVGLVLGAGLPAVNNALRWRPLVYFGQMSFGLYLVHYPLLLWAGNRFGARSLTAAAVAAALTAALGIASWHLLEQPVIRGGRRRFDRVPPPKTAEVGVPTPALISRRLPPE